MFSKWSTYVLRLFYAVVHSFSLILSSLCRTQSPLMSFGASFVSFLVSSW